MVAETKSKLPVKENETGEHRVKFLEDFEGLKQNWTEKINQYKMRVPGRITQSIRSRPTKPNPKIEEEIAVIEVIKAVNPLSYKN